MTKTVTLYKSQCESSEESIIQPEGNRCDEKQTAQRVTPVGIPTVMCYQTAVNNPVVEQTEEINSTDLRLSWGKAVLFITNTSNKLHLSSALHSLAQIPVVMKKDKVKENSSIKENDIDNTNFISESNSSFTFFL